MLHDQLLARCRPTPTPAFSLRSVASPVENGCSKTATRRRGHPVPWSVTETTMPSSIDPRADLTERSSGEYRHAFSKSSWMTPWILASSARANRFPGGPGDDQDRRMEVAHVGNGPVDHGARSVYAMLSCTRPDPAR